MPWFNRPGARLKRKGKELAFFYDLHLPDLKRL